MGAKYDITITLLSPAGMAGGDLHSASAERPSDVPLSQVCMAGLKHDSTCMGTNGH